MQKEPQEGSIAGRDEVLAARKKNAAMKVTQTCPKNVCSPALAVERATVEEDEDQDVDVEDTNVKKGKWSTVNRWDSLPKASIIESPNDTYALRERDAGCFSSLDAEDNTTADADYIPNYRQKRMLEKKKEYMNIPQMSRSEILRQTTSTATRHGMH